MVVHAAVVARTQRTSNKGASTNVYRPVILSVSLQGVNRQHHVFSEHEGFSSAVCPPTPPACILDAAMYLNYQQMSDIAGDIIQSRVKLCLADNCPSTATIPFDYLKQLSQVG
jgi:hypothetical protein